LLVTGFFLRSLAGFKGTPFGAVLKFVVEGNKKILGIRFEV